MALFTTLLSRWESAGTAPGPALTADGEALSWADLETRARRAAGWLAGLGVGRGHIVALRLPRCVEFVELHLGAWALGAATLPLHPGSTPAEVAVRVGEAGAMGPFDDRAVIRAGVDGSEPQGPVAVDPGDLAVLLHTSGTTGRPKGVPITHANVLATVTALHAAWRWTSEDVLVHALPLFHVHGLFVAQLGALYARAHTVWVEPFTPTGVLDALCRFAPAGGPARGVYMGVPTHYARLVTAGPGGRDLSGVRLFTSGSAGLPASVHQAFARDFGHTILERYGMTEVGIVLSNPYDDRRAGTVGTPLPGVEARIADGSDRPVPDGEIGEIQVRGPSVFAGYRNAAEATQKALTDGWMRTGDRGTRDGDGYFRVVGRGSDLVISGGMNVWPAEVEAALGSLPGIAEVAVFGVPDLDLGERVAAAVVPAGPWDPDALMAGARALLSPYKVPRRWVRLDALPRNALGKLQKDVLARTYGVTVRDATPADLDGVVRRNLALCAETEEFRLDEVLLRAGVVRALGGDAGASYLIAERDGEVAGQLMLTSEWSDWRNAEVLWIQSVYVEPAHRRFGVYQALHDAAVGRARARGAAGIRLYVEARNTAAMRTYERAGMLGGHYQVYEQMFGEVVR